MMSRVVSVVTLGVVGAVALNGCSFVAQAGGASPKVAFISDAHFADVFGDLEAEGAPEVEAVDGRAATIRSMFAQLTSTRLFNENSFALRAALTDAHAKGVRLVALPGDVSDDAQPMNIDGLAALLREFEELGMRFFIAPGNHDPNAPFDDRTAGKEDFLTADGQEQAVFATQSDQCLQGDLETVCTDQIMMQGTENLVEDLGDFGYMPRPEDLYWETPFSGGAGSAPYDYEQARAAAGLGEREFEICSEGTGGAYRSAGEARHGSRYTNCTEVIDASYLVEPVEGLWLLAIDGNVHIPNDSFDSAAPGKPGGFDGAGSAGWDSVLTHKEHLLPWIESVVDRAEAQGKKLMAFSHYPAADFLADSADELSEVFADGAFQVDRLPKRSTTEAIAATGLPLHVGGHMHFNNTNDFSLGGDYFVNIQSPSPAVYGAAYKIVEYENDAEITVDTVRIDQVDGFDTFFPAYRIEHETLRRRAESAEPRDWDARILEATDYTEFTYEYFAQLTMLRFVDEYWTCQTTDPARLMTLGDMLTATQLRTSVTLAQLQATPGVIPLPATCATGQAASALNEEEASQLTHEWAVARERAEQIAAAASLTLADFDAVPGTEFLGDFHRTIYAGELAFDAMPPERTTMYGVLADAFPETGNPSMEGELPHGNNPAAAVFTARFNVIFDVLQRVGRGAPSGDFTIDLTEHELVRKADR